MIIDYFFKQPIGEIKNHDLQDAILDVKSSKSKEEALEKAFNFIVKKYKGYRLKTYLFFWKGFESNPNKLWKRNGFMHCTHQNFLLRTILIKSGLFSEGDIKLGHSLVWYISPHQYLKVKLENKTIALDPWNYRFGVPIGFYASGFGYKSLSR